MKKMKEHEKKYRKMKVNEGKSLNSVEKTDENWKVKPGFSSG